MKLPRNIREQFRKYGAKGGDAAAARMSPEQKRSRALKAVQAREKKRSEKSGKISVIPS